jgi:hypothetical protein
MIPTMFSRLAGLAAIRRRTPSSKRSANICRSPTSRVAASACDNEGTKTARKNPTQLGSSFSGMGMRQLSLASALSDQLKEFGVRVVHYRSEPYS